MNFQKVIWRDVVDILVFFEFILLSQPNFDKDLLLKWNIICFLLTPFTFLIVMFVALLLVWFGFWWL